MVHEGDVVKGGVEELPVAQIQQPAHVELLLDQPAPDPIMAGMNLLHHTLSKVSLVKRCCYTQRIRWAAQVACDASASRASLASVCFADEDTPLELELGPMPHPTP